MTSPRRLIIAIDGPAGAGKSTIASAVSKRLGYVNLDTGAMYRALGLKALGNSIPLDSEPELYDLALQSRIELVPTPDGNRVLLDGREVTQLIREPEISDAASRVSVHPKVRQWMVDRQREMGASGGVVMEGRDIGTKVFPDADVKVFLDANPEVRADRRLLQNAAKHGPATTAEEVAAELRKRDERDRSRLASPLEPAPDAVVIDSSRLNIDQVVSCVEELVRRKSAVASSQT